VSSNMLPTNLKGKIECICEGENLTSLINQAVQQGMELENLERLDEHRIRLKVPLSQFIPFYRLVRKAGNRVRIVKKEGFPFFLKRLKKRKFFVVGSVLFFMLILLFTSLIWNVQVEGTEKIPVQHVQALFKKRRSLSRSIENALAGPGRSPVSFAVSTAASFLDRISCGRNACDSDSG